LAMSGCLAGTIERYPPSTRVNLLLLFYCAK
jgi:hypothetical protein